MTDDLIKRLREIEYRTATRMAITTALAEAADEIERLRADGSAMRASITRLVEAVDRLRRVLAWIDNQDRSQPLAAAAVADAIREIERLRSEIVSQLNVTRSLVDGTIKALSRRGRPPGDCG